MSERVVTNFIDDDGLDVGCHLVSKEYVLENYPELVPWMKAPALWAWGSGLYGRLGNNATGALASRSSPVQTVSNGTNWKQAATAQSYSAGIKTDGTLWLWGANFAGTIGDQTIVNRSSPVQTISNVTTWKAITITGALAAAIKTDGSLWTWGLGTYGQLGNQSIVNRSSPVQTVSNVTTWKQVTNTITQAAAAVKTDGSLWTWGNGGYGVLGNNSLISRSSPVQTVSNVTTWKQVSMGFAMTAAVKLDGTLWTWGCNGDGQLGNGIGSNGDTRSSPIQTVSNVNTWKQVSGGERMTAAIKTDGTLWLWGYNGSGALGNGANISRSSPVQTVSGGTNWLKVSVSNISAGIKTDGSLWLWGAESSGGGGNNVQGFASNSPVQTISGGTGWRDVCASEGLIAIRDEGEF